MVAQLFIACVSIVILGWLWFYIVRPILEDFGIIRDEEGAPAAPIVMSRPMTTPPANRPIASPVDQRSTSAVQPMATTSNAINQELNNNSLLPEEAREIIRFQAKVEALAELIKSGQITNMAKGIEAAFGCSRSGKEDSVYQRARRALDPLVTSAPQYRPLSPEQQAAREALGLPEKV